MWLTIKQKSCFAFFCIYSQEFPVVAQHFVNKLKQESLTREEFNAIHLGSSLLAELIINIAQTGRQIVTGVRPT